MKKPRKPARNLSRARASKQNARANELSSIDPRLKVEFAPKFHFEGDVRSEGHLFHGSVSIDGDLELWGISLDGRLNLKAELLKELNSAIRTLIDVREKICPAYAPAGGLKVSGVDVFSGPDLPRLKIGILKLKDGKPIEVLQVSAWNFGSAITTGKRVRVSPTAGGWLMERLEC